MADELRLGGVISRATPIALRLAVPYTIVTIIVASPLILYVGSLDDAPLTLAMIHRLRVFENWRIPLQLIATSTVTYVVFERLHGRGASVGRCASLTVTRAMSIFALQFFLNLPTRLLAPMFRDVLPAPLVYAVIAAPLLTLFAVATPAIMVERLRAMNAMRRSYDLTSGHRVAAAVLVGLTLLLQWGSSVALNQLYGVSTTIREVQRFQATLLVVSAPISVLWATLVSVAYYDLRIAKDGTAPAELARVFD